MNGTARVARSRIRAATLPLWLLLVWVGACGTGSDDSGDDHSVARIWNETLLDAIRVDTPRPTVHARNLYHLSIAMWDCWVAYDRRPHARAVLFHEKHAAAHPDEARRACISHAAHRLLTFRFATSIGAAETLPALDARMRELGYDPDFIGFPTDDGPAAVGYRIATGIIVYGLSDGANEQQGYDDPGYAPYNFPLVFELPGTGFSIENPNLWAPLAFDFACFQNDVPVPAGEENQVFVGAHWNDVTPFALTRDDEDALYVDPGPPPRLVEWDDGAGRMVGPGDDDAKWEMLEVVRHSSRLDPDEAPTIDVSPGTVGNNSLAGIAAYVFDGQGHPVNPHTGLPYPANPVNEADYGRVVAEYWADGPDSETPPGHWNALANAVSDHPDLERRIGGAGRPVGRLEWDVKLYLALNGALHDAAIAAWGTKRHYDSARPIAGIRWLVEQGQSSDPVLPSYSVHGMPLEPGLAELVTPASSAPGERHAHLADRVGEVALYVWPGQPDRSLPPSCGDDEPAEPDPDAEYPDYSGSEWIPGDEWITYQRRTFVTPPFAGYVSGHSTFSRAAAVVLHRLTGDPYFPGGLGEFVAPGNAFLSFEVGPTRTVRLQWATYYDAADEAGLSRLWGGIHVMAENVEGILMGAEVGESAFEQARRYWDGDPLLRDPRDP